MSLHATRSRLPECKAYQFCCSLGQQILLLQPEMYFKSPLHTISLTVAKGHLWMRTVPDIIFMYSRWRFLCQRLAKSTSKSKSNQNIFFPLQSRLNHIPLDNSFHSHKVILTLNDCILTHPDCSFNSTWLWIWLTLASVSTHTESSFHSPEQQF